MRFTTIYPGWYSGRITHVHLRAYLVFSDGEQHQLGGYDTALTVGIAL